MGLFSDKDDMLNVVTCNDRSFCYQIDGIPLCQYGNCVNIHPLNYNKHRCGPFYVECKLHVNGIEFEDPIAIVDTGCEISSLFPDYLWDYNNRAFKSELNISYFKKYKKELEMLKNNLKPLNFVDINTGNGLCDKILLEFIDPVYVSVENLNPVPIYYFLVNKEEADPPLQTLVGLDMLTQYDLHLTKNNNKPVIIMKDYPNEDVTIKSSQINNIFGVK